MSLTQPAISPYPPKDDLEDAARRMLVALGEDPRREGLADTPRRVAESLTYLTEGYGVSPRQVVGSAVFEHAGDDLVVVPAFRSTACASTTCSRSSGAATSPTCPTAGCSA